MTGMLAEPAGAPGGGANAPVLFRAPLPVPEQEAEIGSNPRLGWIVAALFFVGFLGFAAFIRLDAAAYAEGTVKVVGDRQAVQHREGGTVSALHVREGQSVRAGDVLVELAGGDVAANERTLTAQLIGLLAERARLQQERLGGNAIPMPAEFAALDPADQAAARDAVAREQARMLAHRVALGNQVRVLNQQVAQLSEQATGLSRQMDANRQQDSSYADQLKGMQELAKRGYASINRVRELERARASMTGQYAGLDSDRAASLEKIGEVRLRSLSLQTDNERQVADDLRHADEQLNELYPRWREARRQVEGMRIRAPATGQVVGLSIFTVGGVIAPGQKLMEIVPSGAPLVVEARVSPNDADDLHVGQTAELKFPALHDRNVPVINGVLSSISADALTDERTGARYYTAQVKVSADDLAKVKAAKGAGDGIKPGLPVTVLVPLRKRTVLEYLMEPLDQALWRSGHEH